MMSVLSNEPFYQIPTTICNEDFCLVANLLHFMPDLHFWLCFNKILLHDNTHTVKNGGLKYHFLKPQQIWQLITWFLSAITKICI